MKPLIITVAITGAETQKKDQPNLPITPEEQAKEAKRCYEAGAQVIHLHVRDDQGRPTQNVKRFQDTLQAIRAECPILVEFSTGGAVGETLEDRIKPLSLKPDLASLNMGSVNFGDEVFANSILDISKILNECQKNNVMPTLETYDLGMVEYTVNYLAKNKIKFSTINFVLSAGSGAKGEVSNLVHLQSKLNPEWNWGAMGIGRSQLPISLHTILMGGMVRTGFEDNIFYHKGELAKSNAQLVERIVRITKEVNRPVATMDETRKILFS